MIAAALLGMLWEECVHEICQYLEAARLMWCKVARKRHDYDANAYQNDERERPDRPPIGGSGVENMVKMARQIMSLIHSGMKPASSS